MFILNWGPGDWEKTHRLSQRSAGSALQDGGFTGPSGVGCRSRAGLPSGQTAQRTLTGLSLRTDRPCIPNTCSGFGASGQRGSVPRPRSCHRCLERGSKFRAGGKHSHRPVGPTERHARPPGGAGVCTRVRRVRELPRSREGVGVPARVPAFVCMLCVHRAVCVHALGVSLKLPAETKGRCSVLREPWHANFNPMLLC